MKTIRQYIREKATPLFREAQADSLESLSSGEHAPEVFQNIVPKSSLVSWIIAQDSLIKAEVERLETNQPSIVSHPLERIRHMGDMAVLAGQKDMLNQLAEFVQATTEPLDRGGAS